MTVAVVVGFVVPTAGPRRSADGRGVGGAVGGGAAVGGLGVMRRGGLAGVAVTVIVVAGVAVDDGPKGPTVRLPAAAARAADVRRVRHRLRLRERLLGDSDDEGERRRRRRR